MRKCPHCGSDQDVLLDEIKRLRQALEKIRDLDHRGNCHESHFMAADALKPQLMMKESSK